MHDIACRDCGTTFQASTRHRRYCDLCRRQRHLAQQRAKPRKVPTDACTDCGKPVYRGRGSRANPTCRDCRRKRAGLDGSEDRKTADELRRKARVQARKAEASDVPCAHCSQLLTVHQVKEGQRYCSHRCSLLIKGRKADCKQCGKPFNATRDRATYCGNDCRQRALSADGMLHSERVWKWATHVTYSRCRECGVLICWKAPKAYCSAACSRKGSSRLAYARNPERFKRSAHRRRARLKEALVDDVDFRKVYERDKWICHICNNKVRKTPRFPRDPEMASPDHLIPLAMHGTHSYANVACSHLRCNLKKHTSATGEQLMIVGIA